MKGRNTAVRKRNSKSGECATIKRRNLCCANVYLPKLFNSTGKHVGSFKQDQASNAHNDNADICQQELDKLLNKLKV